MGTGNYDNVHVYEDNHKNINAIQNVAKQMGVRFDYTLINVDDNPHTHLREFIQHTLLEKKKKKKENPRRGNHCDTIIS